MDDYADSRDKCLGIVTTFTTGNLNVDHKVLNRTNKFYWQIYSKLSISCTVLQQKHTVLSCPGNMLLYLPKSLIYMYSGEHYRTLSWPFCF